MKLSIITINFNNVQGLRKTIESVINQSFNDIEYIIIDGGSTDGSVELIQLFTTNPPSIYTHNPDIPTASITYWISEPDKGIYHAMNKGIQKASGDYVQFLNSGDTLVSDNVVEKMLLKLEIENQKTEIKTPILYGNMLKQTSKYIFRDRNFCGKDITFLDMYSGTLNHSSAYIRRDLFDKYGYYDEDLKIVSDWKWYLHVIIFGGEKPVYTDIDITLFDLTGISSSNLKLVDYEKQQELSKILPDIILDDYRKWALPIRQMQRIQRHKWAYKCIWILERSLFKYEQLTKREKI